MHTLLYIIKTLYKKKWMLLIIPLIAAITVYFILSSQPKTYKSSTTVYTGIVSGYDVMSSSSHQDWLTISNNIDNLLSIVKSETTLENVFLKLIAQDLINMDVDNDNDYLTAVSSRELAQNTPGDVLRLVVRDSEEETLENLSNYYHADRTNYLQQLFHWNHKYYSYSALSSIKVERVSSSDMLNISYTNQDRYIVYNTLKLISDEFVKQYFALRYEQSDEVLTYFETELENIRRELTSKEDALTDYNVSHQIINYEEQTKQIAAHSANLETEIESVTRTLNGTRNKLDLLESKMGSTSQLFLNNAQFIESLHKISDLYSTSVSTDDDYNIKKGKNEEIIEKESENLRSISTDIFAAQHTKEGIAIDDMVNGWLDELLTEARASAELEVLKKCQREIENEYLKFSPIGSSLKRQNRDINFSEQKYLSNLQALNDAKMRQKNLQLTSATFKTLTPPTVAMSPEKTKNKLYSVIALMLTFALIVTIVIIVELLNKSPYDRAAAERIIGTKVIGAMPLYKEQKHDDICHDFAANQLGNAVVTHFDRTKTNNIINVISMEQGEGKSYFCQALMDYFTRLETHPVYVNWEKDFEYDSKYYLLASSIYDFAINEDNAETLSEADVIIVEHPALSITSFPSKLLTSAAINVIVVDANRGWSGMDHILLKQLRDFDKNAVIMTCLNKADKDSVGAFTGMLPPYDSKHRIRFTMWNLGNNNA